VDYQIFNKVRKLYLVDYEEGRGEVKGVLLPTAAEQSLYESQEVMRSTIQSPLLG
jgi:hypothetical protein